MQKIDTSIINKEIELKDTKKTIEKTPSDVLRGIIESMRPQIKSALPKSFSDERFVRLAVTAIRVNPKLAQVAITNKLSFLGAMMQSVQMGLEPNTPLGEAYLIPYGPEVQFQIGYKGLISLAYRTGEYKSISAEPVYSNDFFEYEYGTEARLKHVPSTTQMTGEPILYYAVWILKNGGHGFAVMSKSQIEAHRDKYSQAVKSGGKTPWKTDFDSMALKTVLKKALKFAPKSIEFSRAFESDETVKHEISGEMFESPSIEVDFSELPND
jgi:recombination protein RecT